MGGGAAMRTAAKFVGFGSAGIRGAPMATPTTAALSSLQAQRAKAADVAPMHTASSLELDDWVVFGGIPSFQEAKAATSELKEAIDRVYLSSNSSASEDSGQLEDVNEVISFSPMPSHALQAFQLLSANAEAQTAVASIACDPNVWNAMMQNSSVKDFFQSQQTGARLEEVGTDEEVEYLPDSNSGNGIVGFMDNVLNKVSLNVAECVSGVSVYLQNIFGYSTAADADGTNGSSKTSFMNHMAMGGTFMGLAVLVAMVVLLKRA